MTDRSILITGCSSGIGYDAALTLHTRGWRVFATCRQKVDCDRLAEAGLTTVQLDYEQADSIGTAVDTVLQATDGRLDALFNNGAYAIPGPVEDLPTDALRAAFEANFFGWHDLTRRLIPTFRAQGAGRIVQCSSVLGFQAMPWRGAYNATKFALEGYSDTLRMELRGTGIHVSLIEPGPIRTDFRKNAIRQFEKWIDWQESRIREQYETGLLTKLYKTGGEPDRGELEPRAVTAKLIHAIEARRPRPRYYVTAPTIAIGYARRLMSTRALDALFSRI